jgi:hypothetical protein
MENGMNKAFFYLIIFCFFSFIANPTSANENPNLHIEDLDGENTRLVVFEEFMRCA